MPRMPLCTSAFLLCFFATLSYASLPQVIAHAQELKANALAAQDAATPGEEGPRPPGFRNRMLRKELKTLAKYSQRMENQASKDSPRFYRMGFTKAHLSQSLERVELYVRMGGVRHLDGFAPAWDTVIESFRQLKVALQEAKEGTAPDPVDPPPPPPPPPPQGRILKVLSSLSPAEAADKLVATIESKGLTVFARIDHQANAAGAGLELGPNQVIVFGNPKAGTLLMHSNPAIGVALPLKMLVWADSEGRTWIGYLNPSQLLADFEIEDRRELEAKISGAMAAFAAAASGS